MAVMLGHNLTLALGDRMLVAEDEGAVDQCDVGEGLREIAELAMGVWIVFLREQAEIVG